MKTKKVPGKVRTTALECYFTGSREESGSRGGK